MFRQEFMASFEGFCDLVYDNFDRNIIVRPLLFDPLLPVFIGLDFGWTDPSVILWVQYDSVNDYWFVLSELVKTHFPLDAVADAIKGVVIEQRNRKPFSAPCPLESITRIFAGGEANQKRQESSGKSSFKVLERYGIPRHLMRSTSERLFPSISHLRSIIGNDERTSLYIDPSCEILIRDFEGYSYPKSGGELPDTSAYNHRFSHTLDALRYVISGVKPHKDWVIPGF